MKEEQVNQIAKQNWRKRVEKELKGESITNIGYKFISGIDLEPIYMDGEVDSFQPIKWRDEARALRGVERFYIHEGTDMGQCHITLKQALTEGAQLIEIYVRGNNDMDWSSLFHGIHLSMIQVRFYGDKSSFSTNAHSFHPSNEQSKWAEYISVESRDFISLKAVQANDTSEALVHLINAIKNEKKKGWAWDAILIQFEIGSHILLEIVKIRVLKLLIYALSDELNIPLHFFPILQAQADEEYSSDNMDVLIDRGVQALTSSLAGVDELYINPKFNSKLELGESDNRKVIRNILSVIHLESNIGHYEDFGHGSYWIEYTTKALFEYTWAKYKVGGEG